MKANGPLTRQAKPRPALMLHRATPCTAPESSRPKATTCTGLALWAKRCAVVSSDLTSSETNASAKYAGDLGGIEAATDLCVELANEATLGGNWPAFLSVPGDQAMGNIENVGPWYLANQSTLVANNKTQLSGRNYSVLQRLQSLDGRLCEWRSSCS